MCYDKKIQIKAGAGLIIGLALFVGVIIKRGVFDYYETVIGK